MTAVRRVGVVEIGSRAVRMLVADVNPRVELRIVASEARDSHLVASLRATRELRHEALQKVIATVKAFVQRCHEVDAVEVCLFGTEALRQMPQHELQELKNVLSSLHVLKPREEALCSLYAAGYPLPQERKVGELLVVDQGAGSMEFALGSFQDGRLTLQSASSCALGAQPLLGRLRALGGNYMTLRQVLIAESSNWPLPKGTLKTTPLVQGSVATKLAWLRKRKSPTERYDPRAIQGVAITLQAMDALISAAHKDPKAVRSSIDAANMDEDDFSRLIVSMIALRIVLEKLGALSFTASSYGTRFGMAWLLAEPKS